MHQCNKFILFWNDTLHVSGDLSFHHQEFKIVHIATAVWLLYVQSLTPDDGSKDRPKHVQCYSNKMNLIHFTFIVPCIIIIVSK